MQANIFFYLDSKHTLPVISLHVLPTSLLVLSMDMRPTLMDHAVGVKKQYKGSSSLTGRRSLFRSMRSSTSACLGGSAFARHMVLLMDPSIFASTFLPGNGH
jgi:hypothetical protein